MLRLAHHLQRALPREGRPFRRGEGRKGELKGGSANEQQALRARRSAPSRQKPSDGRDENRAPEERSRHEVDPAGYTPAAHGPNDAPAVATRGHAFRALRHRGYRAYFSAQTLSFTGTWMQTVAQGWLVYRLTGSSLLLGSVTLAAQLPTLFLSPLAGVVADRFELRKLVALTQGLLAAITLLLAALTFADRITVELLLGLAALGGIVTAFDMPARQTLLVELAGPEDLSSAIALNSAGVNLARLVGPAVAGVTVAALGEAPCFLVNSLTFMAPIAVTLLVRPPHTRKSSAREPLLQSLRAGLSYARRAPHIRAIFPVAALTSLVAFPYLPLLPVFAADVLDGGPELLGWLQVAVGLGSMTGALAVAALVDRRKLLPRLTLGVGCYGLGLIVLGVSTSVTLSLVVLPVVGFGMLSQLSCSNTIIQGDTPEQMRGRVMALYNMVLIGFYPLGAVLVGWIGERFGVGPTVAVGGAITVACALTLMRRLPALRALKVGEGAAG